MQKLRVRGSSIAADVHAAISGPHAAPGCDWRQALPVLHGRIVTLREPLLSDASALCSMVSTEEVSRFMSSPPESADAFQRFITWTHRERAAGNLVCFAVVPHGMDQPVGIFQVRRLNSNFETAEWGFAIGSRFWKSGVYADAAAMVLDFAFSIIGAHRLEARAAVSNGRGNGALCKMGATRGRVLQGSLLKDGQYLDQVLWTILDQDWRRTSAAHFWSVH